MTRIDIGASPRPEPEMTSESGGSSDTEEEVGGGGGRHHTAESHHEDKKVGAFSEYYVPRNFAETSISCSPQPVTILDWRDDSGMSDNLFTHSDRSAQGCTHSRCNGSKVGLLSTRINYGVLSWVGAVLQ